MEAKSAIKADKDIQKWRFKTNKKCKQDVEITNDGELIRKI